VWDTQAPPHPLLSGPAPTRCGPFSYTRGPPVRHTTTALALTVLALAVACEPAVVDQPPATPWAAATLTTDGTDRYTLAGDPAFTTVTAPLGNQSGNTRVAITPTGAVDSVDQAICTTITGATAPNAQPGVVLRHDGVHAITVTRNIWAGIYTVINVHAWDLNLPPDNGRFVLAGQWPLTGLGHPGPAAPFPWRLCATAHANTVAFKVWPLTRPTPTDGDPCCTGALPLPVWAGRPGLYAGHLPPGHTLAYSDTTWSSP
jgi:hypothetical protein